MIILFVLFILMIGIILYDLNSNSDCPICLHRKLVSISGRDLESNRSVYECEHCKSRFLIP